MPVLRNDGSRRRASTHYNVFSVTPRSKIKLVAAMLKAIHAQEDKAGALEKAKAVAGKLREMKLKEAADKVEKGVPETLAYMRFPREHWTKIHRNNAIERLNREIRRRTRVVGTFPDGQSVLIRGGTGVEFLHRLGIDRLADRAAVGLPSRGYTALKDSYAYYYKRIVRSCAKWNNNLHVLTDAGPCDTLIINVSQKCKSAYYMAVSYG